MATKTTIKKTTAKKSTSSGVKTSGSASSALVAAALNAQKNPVSSTGKSGKIESEQTTTVPNFTYAAPAAYSSQYAGQIDAALNNVTNFKYDPLQDASYKALAKVYTANGDRAAKSSMADAAALNGGYGTSYAVSAAQQMRNQYNSELASRIPELEQNAYNRNLNTLSALREADDTAYGRYRDSVSDSQWQAQFNYGIYNDDRNYALDLRGLEHTIDKDNAYLDIDRTTAKVNNKNTQASTGKIKTETRLLKKGKSSGSGSGGGSSYSGAGGYSYLGGSNPFGTMWSGASKQANSTKTTTKQKGNGSKGKSTKNKASNPYPKYSPAWYGWNNKNK